jgi:hypothetical protein
MKTLVSRGAGLLVAGLVLASTACAYGLGPATGARRVHDPHGAVQLNVTNLSGGTMEVYAVGSGTVYRIGTVHPTLGGRFTVRPAVIVNGPVEFVARSASGALVRSGPILLAPGDVVEFELAANPVSSTAVVRPRLPASYLSSRP